MTLMEQLEALREGMMENPSAHVGGELMTKTLRCSEMEIFTFQDEMKRAAKLLKLLSGNSDLALDGMIQTVLTVGYQLCLTHQAEDAEANVGQDDTWE